MSSRTVEFKPFIRQYEALVLLMDDETNEILYGGGARGGKSYLGCAWIITQAMSKNKSSWLIARKRFSDLRDTTLRTFNKVARELGVEDSFTYHAQSKTAEFTNGSIVFFKDINHEPSDPEYDRLGSYELTGAFLDEAQEINSKAISVLRGRFSELQGDDWKTIPKMFFSCNPKRNWVYNEFYKPHKVGTLTNDKAFIPSLATDNPYVSNDYIENLKKSDKVTVQRLLYGNFEYEDTQGLLMKFDNIQDIFTNTITKDGEKYMTVDVARYGGDKIVLNFWDGLESYRRDYYEKQGTDKTIQLIRDGAAQEQIPFSHIIIDEDGIGGGVIDQLQGVKGFVNNSTPLQTKQPTRNQVITNHSLESKREVMNFANLKAQCGFKLAELVETHKIAVTNAEVSERETIAEELVTIKQKDPDKDGKLRLIPKEVIKEELGRSPDASDTFIFRMYFEILKGTTTLVPPTRRSLQMTGRTRKITNSAI